MNKEELRKLLKEYIPFECKISIRDKTNTIISIKRGLFYTSVVLNAIYLIAEKSLILEIAFFIKNFNTKNHFVTKSREKIRNFYEDNKHLIPLPVKKTTILKSNFKNHNIYELYAGIINKLSQIYTKIDFSTLKITWGKMTRKRTRSIRFGSFSKTTNLIRIHPILDDTKIPNYFIKSVIYHETAHFIYQRLYPDSRTHHNITFYNLLKQIDENYTLSEEWEHNNKRLFF